MNAEEFRAIALRVSGAIESEHMNLPDFRVTGKVFASLGYPDEGWGMIKLTPTQQRSFMKAAPETFVPCAGASGKGGATSVHFVSAKKWIPAKALRAASQNIVNPAKSSTGLLMTQAARRRHNAKSSAPFLRTAFSRPSRMARTKPFWHGPRAIGFAKCWRTARFE